MTVTGGDALRRRYATAIGRITGPRTRSTIAKVLSAGMTNAKENAPMEYGTLINSAFRRVVGSNQMGWKGVCGFTVAYAYYLHGDDTYTPSWSPRAPEDKEGPAWNPFATPKFLELGFVGPLAIDETERIIQQGYRR